MAASFDKLLASFDGAFGILPRSKKERRKIVAQQKREARAKRRSGPLYTAPEREGPGPRPPPGRPWEWPLWEPPETPSEKRWDAARTLQTPQELPRPWLHFSPTQPFIAPELLAKGVPYATLHEWAHIGPAPSQAPSPFTPRGVEGDSRLQTVQDDSWKNKMCSIVERNLDTGEWVRTKGPITCTPEAKAQLELDATLREKQLEEERQRRLALLPPFTPRTGPPADPYFKQRFELEPTPPSEMRKLFEPPKRRVRVITETAREVFRARTEAARALPPLTREERTKIAHEVQERSRQERAKWEREREETARAFKKEVSDK